MADNTEIITRLGSVEERPSTAFGWSVRAWIAILLTITVCLKFLWGSGEIPTSFMTIYGIVLTHYYTQRQQASTPAVPSPTEGKIT